MQSGRSFSQNKLGILPALAHTLKISDTRNTVGIDIRQGQTLQTSVREFCLSSVQLLSRVRLFVTPWTKVFQASLSSTISQSLFKFMSIESVVPSNHLILCHSLLLLPSIFPSVRVFSSDGHFASNGQSIGASASVLPMNTQD